MILNIEHEIFLQETFILFSQYEINPYFEKVYFLEVIYDRLFLYITDNDFYDIKREGVTKINLETDLISSLYKLYMNSEFELVEISFQIYNKTKQLLKDYLRKKFPDGLTIFGGLHSTDFQEFYSKSGFLFFVQSPDEYHFEAWIINHKLENLRFDWYEQ